MDSNTSNCLAFAGGIACLFLYSALGALALRGTVGQVATAEKALEEMKVK